MSQIAECRQGCVLSHESAPECRFAFAPEGRVDNSTLRIADCRYAQPIASFADTVLIAACFVNSTDVRLEIECSAAAAEIDLGPTPPSVVPAESTRHIALPRMCTHALVAAEVLRAREGARGHQLTHLVWTCIFAVCADWLAINHLSTNTICVNIAAFVLQTLKLGYDLRSWH